MPEILSSGRVAGTEHASKNKRENPPRNQGPHEPTLEQILNAIREQTALGMLVEAMAVPPEDKGRADRCIHKQVRGICLLPLACPTDRQAKLLGLDAESVPRLGVGRTHDLLHNQRTRSNERDVLWVLMKGVEGFRSGCDGSREFKNNWFHGKNCA